MRAVTLQAHQTVLLCPRRIPWVSLARQWGLCFVVLLLAGAAACAGPAVSRPNIVFILADDMGWSDLGCYGADLHETPHLDRLARQGVRFTQAYGMSVCSPTRACLLTGKHAARLQMTTWRESALATGAEAPVEGRRLIPPKTVADLPHREKTIARLLQEQGYRTFHVGKWHLGDADHSPETHGFELNIGGTHWGAPSTYFHPFSGPFGPLKEQRYVPGFGAGRRGDYLTDRTTDEALKIIDAVGREPFFLNLWYHSPHTPLEAPTNLVRRFQARLRPDMHHQNPVYAAMIASLDANVGRLLQHLEKRGLARNTMVIFMSDNGGSIGNFRERRITDNYPLRSGKGSLYEGGVRVPLFIRWPGHTAAGLTVDEPVLCTDLFPTMAEAVGASPETAADGLSLWPLLRQAGGHLGRTELFFHYPHYYATTTPVSAVRHGDWKLVEYLEDHRVELYNLRTDPGESHDLAATEPAKAAELQVRLHEWWKEVGAPLPHLP